MAIVAFAQRRYDALVSETAAWILANGNVKPDQDRGHMGSSGTRRLRRKHGRKAKRWR